MDFESVKAKRITPLKKVDDRKIDRLKMVKIQGSGQKKMILLIVKTAASEMSLVPNSSYYFCIRI